MCSVAVAARLRVAGLELLGVPAEPAARRHTARGRADGLRPDAARSSAGAIRADLAAAAPRARGMSAAASPRRRRRPLRAFASQQRGVGAVVVERR